MSFQDACKALKVGFLIGAGVSAVAVSFTVVGVSAFVWGVRLAGG